MSKLPQGWTSTTFGAINEFRSKSINPMAFPDEEFELYSVPSYPSGSPEIALGSTIGSTKQIVKPDDVLVCKINPRINRVWKVGPAGSRRQIASSEWIVHRTSDANPRYLRHYFSSREFRELICEDLTGVGGSLTRAQPKRVAAFHIPLAPFAEQKRIADKLDRLLAAVDTCKARLDAIPVILKRFRQSVLAAATSGELTKEWRGNPMDKVVHVRVVEPYSHVVKAPESWRKVMFGEICNLIGGSQPPKFTFKASESSDVIRLIQIRDYKSDRFKVFIPRHLARRFCSSTDVMIGRYGPPIFQILRGLDGAYNVALMKAEPRNEELNREYLYYWLNRESLLRYVEAGSDRTAGQDGVRKELLHPYPFYLPPPMEQTEIVRRIDLLFAHAQRIESRYRKIVAAVENLTPALLAKAFCGELVSNDPDELAESQHDNQKSEERRARVQKQDTRRTGIRRERGAAKSPAQIE